MPLDILLPFWGEPAFLFKTVESVLAQSNDDWKLTVVDDAYPDESVPAYFARIDDERVSYVRNEQNAGITENYAICRSLATEDLMMFLGCDDLMHPNFVDSVFAAHARFPNAAVIQPGVEVIDEQGRIVMTLADRVKRAIQPSRTEPVELAGEDLAVSLLRGNWLYWPSLVFRRDVLLDFEFRDGLPIVQDLALVLDMVHAGHSVLLDPNMCFSYRRHTGSASATAIYDGRRFAGDRRYFAIAAQQARDHGWKRAERTARMRLTSRAHALSLIPGALITGKVSAIKPLLTHATHR